jgi:hypothetical protein
LDDINRQYSFLNAGTLNTAEGNDIITVDGPRDGLLNFGTFTMGEGNDIITVDAEGTTSMVNSGTLNMGEGHDIITIKGREGSSPYILEPSPQSLLNFGTFNTAGGDDVITAESNYSNAILIEHGSIFDTGDGNDRIKGNNNASSFNYNFTSAIFNRSYDFNTGDGNDTIEGNGGIRGIYNEGAINTGKGKDIIIANVKFPDGFITLSNSSFSTIPIIDTGEDDDIITVEGGLLNRGIINTGNGDDSIINSVGEFWGF